MDGGAGSARGFPTFCVLFYRLQWSLSTIPTRFSLAKVAVWLTSISLFVLFVQLSLFMTLSVRIDAKKKNTVLVT